MAGGKFAVGGRVKELGEGACGDEGEIGGGGE